MGYGVINSDLITTSDGVSSAGLYGFKNKIINGSMVIDQRNAGASVTPTSTITYTLDRWAAVISQASKFTVQQNAASVTPPVGFSNYLGITSSSAYSALTGDYFFVQQVIEGFNASDLAWGTASAQTVTLSFWVRSSLTGTFSGALRNSAQNRSYPFTYTISAANTWEQKSVTIAGDTSGTWVTNNGAGIYISLNLGAGATFSGTASAWAAGNFTSATGATSVVGTSGATFYITGVQLEKGSTATSFDYLDYGRSLAQCQRYYERQVWSTGAAAALLLNTGYTNGVANVFQTFKFAVEKRAAATTTKLGTWSVSNAGQPLVYGSDTFGCSLYFVSTGAASSPYALAAGSGQGFDATAEL